MTTIINKPANLVYVMQGTCTSRILENIHVKNIAWTCSIYTEFHKRMYRCIKFLSQSVIQPQKSGFKCYWSNFRAYRGRELPGYRVPKVLQKRASWVPFQSHLKSFPAFSLFAHSITGRWMQALHKVKSNTEKLWIYVCSALLKMNSFSYVCQCISVKVH